MTSAESAGPTMAQRIADPRARKERALQMGGAEGLHQHRASGRLPVRERIGMLLDPDSWFELGALALLERRTAKHVPGDGVVTGFGLLDG